MGTDDGDGPAMGTDKKRRQWGQTKKEKGKLTNKGRQWGQTKKEMGTDKKGKGEADKQGDALRNRESQWWAPSSCPGNGSQLSGRQEGQGEMEGTALARCGFDPDAPPIVFNDLLADGQPQTGAGWL